MKALLGTLALISALVGGCAGGQSPGPTAFPLPSAAVAVALHTQPAVSVASGVGAGCTLLELQPVVVSWDASRKVISFGDAEVLWPRGFSARFVGSRLEIVAPNGSVVARDGDLVTLGGSDYAHICRVDSIEYPAG